MIGAITLHFRDTNMLLGVRLLTNGKCYRHDQSTAAPAYDVQRLLIDAFHLAL